MQVRRWFASTTILLLLVCASALAQETTMQLLAPSKGWALGNGGLFWTEDNGEHWNDITPERAEGTIASVFFLDESRGWVLLSADAGGDMISLELATTTNGGHNWSFTPVPIPKQFSDELSGAVWVDFADAEHGWIVLREHTSSAFSIARLLATQDGGDSWHELPQTPLGAPVLFVNSTDGWLAGDSGTGGSGNLYHTRDGGKNWEGADLQDPSSSVAMNATYGTLRFTDAKHGSIPVTFSPITDSTKGSTLVLFTTADGGKTWKADRVLHLRDESVLSALADSTFLVVRGAALTAVGPDGAISNKPFGGVPADAYFNEISFVNPIIGWLRTSDGKLLSTTDGAETLTWLIPGSAPRKLPPPHPVPKSPPIRMTPIGPATLKPSAPRSANAPAPGLHYTERLGFDRQQSLTPDEMTTWWKSSPFFDVGFYVGGVNYCYSYNSVTKTCTTRLDPNIVPGSTWITKETNQGWGFMPIWVGEQAPCNTKATLTKFDYNTTTAQNEGALEALNAISAINGVGLSGLIFYDMENYSTTAGSTCSLAVRAFLTGWVNTMNANGFPTTAVYGNPGPAQRDFSQVTNLTEVWIAQTAAAGNKWPHVTIWGLGSSPNALEDIQWNNSQRGHQFLIGASSDYGGLTKTIDYDVENFQIPGGSGVKPYNWVTSTEDMSGLCGSYYMCFGTAGINDVVWNSTSSPFTSFITKGQIGEVVGSYVAEKNGCPDGICEYGFIDNNGVLTSITEPNGPNQTAIAGVNNKSEIVGLYCYGTYQGISGYCNPYPRTTFYESGFLGTSPLGASSYTPFNYASNGETVLDFINDDEQIVGSFSTGSTFLQLLYQNGSPSTLSLPTCPGQGSGGLVINSLNGFSELAGYYYDSTGIAHGFVINLQPPESQQCIPVDITPSDGTFVLGINNQGQVLGYYFSTTSLAEDCYFMLDTGVAYNLPFFTYVFNDAAQITGVQATTLSQGCPVTASTATAFNLFSPI